MPSFLQPHSVVTKPNDKNYLSGCSEEFFVGSFLAARRNTLCISRGARSDSGEKEPEKPKENFLSWAQKISHCKPSGCNAIPRHLICASFPPTVLTVSGSRVVTTKSNLSRMHPAPRRLFVMRFKMIITENRQLSTESFHRASHPEHCRGIRFPK